MSRLLARALLVVLCVGVVRADPTFDPDTEAARRHYLTGRELYTKGSYEAACVEFSTARKLLSLPALDYNLAKCEERLEHWSNAIDLYERYLGEVDAREDTSVVRLRVAQLRQRVAELEKATTPQKPGRPLRTAAIVMAATTVALAGAGTGAYLSEWRSYRDEEKRCDHQCTHAQTAGLTTRVDRAERAGYALWGLAGAAAIVDVALWVVDARRHRAAHRVMVGETVLP